MSQINRLLERHNLRKTDFRKGVLEIFLSHKGKALSQGELELELDEADRITLYRTLKTFQDKGLIHQANDNSGKNKFALCGDECTETIHRDRHAHFHCVKCGATICLDQASELSIEVPKDFIVYGSRINLDGVCQSCSLS